MLVHSPNEFEENLLMDDLDIDEILECEDIESTAFISSSKQLLSVLDNVINCIDDRINSKKGVVGGVWGSGGVMFSGRSGGGYCGGMG